MGSEVPESPHHPPAQHLLLPSSFTRDTSKLFLRGGRGLMSTGRWAMAPRRASLTAAALRPNTRQLLLWAYGGQRPGGHPRPSHHPWHLGCSPVLDDDTGADIPGAALVLGLGLGPRPFLRGSRCLRCLGRRPLLGSALPPAGSHPGRAEAVGPTPEQEGGTRNAALGGKGISGTPLSEE